MPTGFAKQEILEDKDCSITSEIELMKPNHGYDEGGLHPRFRVVFCRNQAIQACESFEEMARVISLLNFPIVDFAERHPGQIASIVASVAGLSRPIQNNELFKFIESDYDVLLSEVAPAVVNSELHWFELPPDRLGKLRSRRLILDSFSFIE
jgi:hypothetical protein